MKTHSPIVRSYKIAMQETLRFINNNDAGGIECYVFRCVGGRGGVIVCYVKAIMLAGLEVKLV